MNVPQSTSPLARVGSGGGSAGALRRRVLHQHNWNQHWMLYPGNRVIQGVSYNTQIWVFLWWRHHPEHSLLLHGNIYLISLQPYSKSGIPTYSSAYSQENKNTGCQPWTICLILLGGDKNHTCGTSCCGQRNKNFFYVALTYRTLKWYLDQVNDAIFRTYQCTPSEVIWPIGKLHIPSPM